MTAFDFEPPRLRLTGNSRLSGWASKGAQGFEPQRRYSPPPPSSDASASKPSAANIGAAVFGQLAQAYAGFHQVQMAQIETRSAADFAGHRARMLELDYRSAFRQAQNELERGQAAIGDTRLEGAQRRAALQASAAASGTDVSGNAAEVLASDRLVEDIDVYHINLASVQSSNAARREAVAIENEQRMERVRQRNLRRTAKYAQPEAALIGGLLNAVSSGASMGGY